MKRKGKSNVTTVNKHFPLFNSKVIISITFYAYSAYLTDEAHYLSPYILALNSLIWSEVMYSSYSIILSMIPFGVSSIMRLATV